MQHNSFGDSALGRLALGSFLSAAIAPLVLAAPARADALNWTYSPATHQLEITVSGGTPRYFLAAEPARIVLDLPNTEVDPIATQQTYSTGAIRQIRIAQFQPGQARLVMELAPGTVLAPGQVELRRINGDRWVIRPLLIGETAAVGETADPATLPPSAPPASPIPRTIATPSMVFPGAIAPATPATPTPENSSSSLPPLEPGALAIPVEAPPPSRSSGAPAPGAPAPLVPNASAPSAPSAIALSVTPPFSSSPAQPGQPSPAIAPTAAPAAAPLPADLPPATQSSDRARVAIRVPAIDPTAAPVRSPLPAAPSRPLPSLPALQPAPTPLPEAAAPVYLSALPPAAPSNVIEFGQPLGNVAAAGSGAAAELLIPAGTVLNLRHAGGEPIALSNPSQQEVLLLDEAVRDRSGNIIIPANSEVIGRFETSDAGSQFIAQSINWQDQTLLLNAQSEVLRGDRRLLGLLGRSRLRQIQPNQVVKVRLTEDLIR